MILAGKNKVRVLFGVLIIILASGVIYYRIPIWEKISTYALLLTDRDQVKAVLTSFGIWAPLVFILLQISQVVLAPIPGEATGFIGGYLFGVLPGFFYSTIGLTSGSYLNFFIGRFLGEKAIRRFIPADKKIWLDKVIKHEGILIVFILFIVPGFPKDYLCLFLGIIDNIPLRAFILLAAMGRMPGTLLLSLQGAALFDRSYGLFALVFGISLLSILLAYGCRHRLYAWIERLNNKT